MQAAPAEQLRTVTVKGESKRVTHILRVTVASPKAEATTSQGLFTKSGEGALAGGTQIVYTLADSSGRVVASDSTGGFDLVKYNLEEAHVLPNQTVMLGLPRRRRGPRPGNRSPRRGLASSVELDRPLDVGSAGLGPVDWAMLELLHPAALVVVDLVAGRVAALATLPGLLRPRPADRAVNSCAPMSGVRSEFEPPSKWLKRPTPSGVPSSSVTGYPRRLRVPPSCAHLTRIAGGSSKAPVCGVRSS